MLGFKTGKETRRGSPVYPTRVSTEGVDTRQNLVESAFITIRAAMMQFAMLRSELVPAEPPALTEIRFRTNGRRYEEPGYEFASDGFALHKNTKNGLVDHSHTLLVPTKSGEPEYRRECFNVDPQCLPSKSLHLVGYKAISGNADALVEVLSFERDLVYLSLVNASDREYEQ